THFRRRKNPPLWQPSGLATSFQKNQHPYYKPATNPPPPLPPHSPHAACLPSPNTGGQPPWPAHRLRPAPAAADGSGKPAPRIDDRPHSLVASPILSGIDCSKDFASRSWVLM